MQCALFAVGQTPRDSGLLLFVGLEICVPLTPQKKKCPPKLEVVISTDWYELEMKIQQLPEVFGKECNIRTLPYSL